MDNNLRIVYKTEKGTPVTDSIKVACAFGKLHKNVLKSVRNMIQKGNSQYFYERKYVDGNGKCQPYFIMNEQGFNMIIKNGLSEELRHVRNAVIDSFHGNDGVVINPVKKEKNISEIVHVSQRNGQQAVSARELHSFLESGKDFSSWIKDRIEQYGFVKGIDFDIIPESGDNCSQVGRPKIEYVLSIDTAKQMAMVEGNEKGKQARLYFIEVEKRFRAMIQTTPAIPQTFAEALRLAASQAEQIEEQKKRLDAQAPKVLFAQSVETAKQSVLICELAKILCQNGIDTGERRLFQWLRDNHYLCSNGERYNQPTQKAVEMGLFEMKKTTINKPSGETIVSTTTKVTGKGQIYFVNKFLYNQQQNKDQ